MPPSVTSPEPPEESLRRSLEEYAHQEALEGMAGDMADALSLRSANDLVPFWISPGPAHVQRKIPLFALSLETGKLVRLQRGPGVSRRLPPSATHGT